MEFQIKRFAQTLQLPQLTALSIISALISLQLLVLTPINQFIITSLFTAVILAVTITLKQRREKLSSTFLFLTLVILSTSFFPELLAAVFSIGLLFALTLPFHSLKLPGLAIVAHLADLSSTIIAKEAAEEANPFMEFLMNQIGFEAGLIISKIFLIFLPVLWGSKNMDGFERELFLNFVYVIGLAMAVRNTLIFLI